MTVSTYTQVERWEQLEKDIWQKPEKGFPLGNRASETGDGGRGQEAADCSLHPRPQAPQTAVTDKGTRIPSDSATVALIHQSHIKCLVIQ